MLLSIAVLAGCASDERRSPVSGVAEESTTPSAPPGGALIRFGDAVVAAEVADENDERQVGLMNREELASDAGMLFTFPAATTAGFWMKNTLVPLSIGFLRATGPRRYRLAEVQDMEPCPSGSDCPMYFPADSYDAALEVNRGWFEQHDVRVGAEAVVEEAGS